MIGQAVAESAREMKEREYRKNNMIIFKVPMCEAEQLKTRIEEDMKFVDMLVKEGLEFEEEVNVLKVNRLGKKEDKDRPMRVIFKKPGTVEELLKKARNLKGKTQFKDISVSGDKTPLEREERKRLMIERDRRQADSDEKEEGVTWAVRGERLIKVVKKEDQGAVGGRPAEDWN